MLTPELLFSHSCFFSMLRHAEARQAAPLRHASLLTFSLLILRYRQRSMILR